MTVSARDVSNLISQLKCGKAAGSGDLCAESMYLFNNNSISKKSLFQNLD